MRRRRCRCRRGRTGRTAGGTPSSASCAGASTTRCTSARTSVVSTAATTLPAESASRIVGRKSTDITAPGYSNGVLGVGRSICEPPPSVPDSARSSSSPTASVVLVASEFGRKRSIARPSTNAIAAISTTIVTMRPTGPRTGGLAATPAEHHGDGERGEHDDGHVRPDHVAEPDARRPGRSTPSPAARGSAPLRTRRGPATASSPPPCRCSTARTPATGGRTRAGRSGAGCPPAGRCGRRGGTGTGPRTR